MLTNWSQRLGRLIIVRIAYHSSWTICDTGGGRRTCLRSLFNVTKRYLIAAAAHNLGRILRKLFGVGKPKTFQGKSDLTALVQFVVVRFLIAVGALLGWYRPMALYHTTARR